MKDFDFKEMSDYFEYYDDVTCYEYSDFLKSIKPWQFNDELKKKMDNYKNIIAGIRKARQLMDFFEIRIKQVEKIERQDEDEGSLNRLSESCKEHVLTELDHTVVCYKGMYFSLSIEQFARYIAICEGKIGKLSHLEFLSCLVSDTDDVSESK